MRRSGQGITVSTNFKGYRISRTQWRWESLTHLWQTDIILSHHSHYSSLRPFLMTKVSCGLWLQRSIATWFRCRLGTTCADVVIFALSKLDFNFYSSLTLTKLLRCDSFTKIKYLIVESNFTERFVCSTPDYSQFAAFVSRLINSICICGAPQSISCISSTYKQ